MTDRLADVSARIDGIRQLGAVVNAMKGIAAARARTARAQIAAVDSYAATVAAAISDVIGPAPPMSSARPTGGQMGGQKGRETRGGAGGQTGLLVFCAEQGFAGAFSERVLDSIGPEIETASLFLIGTRGLSIAAARGLVPLWSAPMSSHTPSIPKLADGIAKAIYRALDEGRFDRLDVIHASRASGQTQVRRRVLLPIDLSDLPAAGTRRPLTQLPAQALIHSISADYIHALICKAALHAFAAENEARMEAMSSAGSQIARELGVFEATLRRVRQEAITAEIIELGTGAATARGSR
jgi:F-type H+-transporting ATPase subunit gamma